MHILIKGVEQAYTQKWLKWLESGMYVTTQFCGGSPTSECATSSKYIFASRQHCMVVDVCWMPNVFSRSKRICAIGSVCQFLVVKNSMMTYHWSWMWSCKWHQEKMINVSNRRKRQGPLAYSTWCLHISDSEWYFPEKRSQFLLDQRLPRVCQGWGNC